MKVKTYKKLPIPVNVVKYDGTQESRDFIVKWSLTHSTCSVYTPIVDDDLGFAIKATYAEINGQEIELFKDPKTDSSKKSHRGLMMLTKENGKFVTKDQATHSEEKSGLLETVFFNGKLTKFQTFKEIRNRIDSQL